ncbi:Membrane protein insertase YidC [Trichinella pseudospiralis]
MRAYSIYQLAGTRREKERTGHRIECFYLQKQKRIRQKKMFFWFLFLSQTYSLIDTATLRSTEAQVDAASGQLNNVPNQHNTLARFSRMLHSPNSVCLSLFVYLPPVTTMTSIVRI